MKRIALVLSMLMLPAACTTLPAPPAGAERITRVEANGDVIEEFRIGAMVRMVRVTPRFGVPYTLIDRNGDGRFERPQGELPAVYYTLYRW